jgi:hypothetical protein
LKEEFYIINNSKTLISSVLPWVWIHCGFIKYKTICPYYTPF